MCAGVCVCLEVRYTKWHVIGFVEPRFGASELDLLTGESADTDLFRCGMRPRARYRGHFLACPEERNVRPGVCTRGDWSTEDQDSDLHGPCREYPPPIHPSVHLGKCCWYSRPCFHSCSEVQVARNSFPVYPRRSKVSSVLCVDMDSQFV